MDWFVSVLFPTSGLFFLFYLLFLSGKTLVDVRSISLALVQALSWKEDAPKRTRFIECLVGWGSSLLIPCPYPLSLIPCPYPLSLIPCPLSLVPCPLSLVPCPWSLILAWLGLAWLGLAWPLSLVLYPLSLIPCLLSFLWVLIDTQDSHPS
jgi:hypothetical protein